MDTPVESVQIELEDISGTSMWESLLTSQGAEPWAFIYQRPATASP